MTTIMEQVRTFFLLGFLYAIVFVIVPEIVERQYGFNPTAWIFLLISVSILAYMVWMWYQIILLYYSPVSVEDELTVRKHREITAKEKEGWKEHRGTIIGKSPVSVEDELTVRKHREITAKEKEGWKEHRGTIIGKSPDSEELK